MIGKVMVRRLTEVLFIAAPRLPTAAIFDGRFAPWPSWGNELARSRTAAPP